jgi:hypothetical protein
VGPIRGSLITAAFLGDLLLSLWVVVRAGSIATTASPIEPDYTAGVRNLTGRPS